MKVTVGLVMVLVVAGALAWMAFVRAPAPEAVCQHIIDVTIEEAGQQAMANETQDELIERMKRQCIEHKRDELQLRGKIAYARYARCVMRGETLRAIEDC